MSITFNILDDLEVLMADSGLPLPNNEAQMPESEMMHMVLKNDEAERDRTATLALLSALDPFRRANPTMTLQQLTAFLQVAQKEGQQVTHYAARAGVAQGVMTRHLFDLGETNRKREPGLGLLEQRADIMDRRAHLTYLTHKGRQVVDAYRRSLDMYASKWSVA